MDTTFEIVDIRCVDGGAADTGYHVGDVVIAVLLVLAASVASVGFFW